MSNLSVFDESNTKGVASIGKALKLMLALVENEGRVPASKLAYELGLPPSSSRRILGALASAGLIMRISHGRYAAGPALEHLQECVSSRARLVRAAEAPLRSLARTTRATTHLGVLEGDMVTYLARESLDPKFNATQIGAQFEPYCTGIGKILLAGLPPKERNTFFDGGPLVPVTSNTLTDPELFRAEIEKCGQLGYAVDEAEMFENIRCVAVPIQREGYTVAAISLSRLGGPVHKSLRARDLARLKACANDISSILGY